MRRFRFLLANGQACTIRPMTLDDLAAIDAMHNRLSRQSLYSRYFVAYKPSLDVLREQTQLSQCRGTALVAFLDSSPNDIVGMAYYLITADDVNVAEPAFLVEDRYQGQGLGRALFEALVRNAQSQALHGFQLFILPENQRMFQILDHRLLPMQRHYRDGMVEVQLSLNPYAA